MTRIMNLLFSTMILFLSTNFVDSKECTAVSTFPKINPQNNCISFSVSAGTGCSWMCDYCANNLGTTNYYFTDSVCTYQTGGCQGNPIEGKIYTCCSY